MKIHDVKIITDTLLNSINNLIPQLSSSSNSLTKKELEEIINSENTVLFIAEEEDKILGTLTLVFNKIPTVLKVWIEDVVVDETARGKGVGKKLTQFAVNYAFEKGAKQINLTSSPDRVIANKLYQKLGFIKRETNVYRFTLKD